jgi:hypothetical protein
MNNPVAHSDDGAPRDIGVCFCEISANPSGSFANHLKQVREGKRERFIAVKLFTRFSIR